MKRQVFTCSDRTMPTSKNFVDFFATDELGRLISYESVEYEILDANGGSVVSGTLTEISTGRYSSAVVIPEVAEADLGVGKIIWTFIRELGGEEETCEQKLEILEGAVTGFYRYALIADVRAEGYNLKKTVGSETVYIESDEQISRALQFAESLIDKATGWFFGVDYRKESFRGEESKLKQLDFPLIAFLNLKDYTEPTDIADIVDIVFTATYVGLNKLQMNTFIEDAGNAYNPRLWYYNTFKGKYYYTIDGLFGFTEPDYIGYCPWGRVPDPIRRATVKLAIIYLTKMSDGTAPELLDAVTTKEKTMDQEIQQKAMLDYMLEMQAGRYVTGDPEIDTILYMYRSPMGIKAV